MGVKREDFQAIDLMPDHHVIAVVGESGMRVDVSDPSRSRAQGVVGGFVAPVPLQRADVEALMQLSPTGPDAAELTAGPGFAGGAHEIPLGSTVRFEDRAVGRG